MIKISIKKASTILYLMDCAEVAGMCIHKLTQMIRDGATEDECMTELNKCLRASNEINHDEVPF